MHLAVDDARQHVQAATINGFSGGSGTKIADCGNPATIHTNVALADAVMIDDDAALEDEVVGHSHPLRPLCGNCLRLT